MLLTRVSTTKGWGEAYQKSTILDALVWIEFSVSNGMKKLDTVSFLIVHLSLLKKYGLS